MITHQHPIPPAGTVSVCGAKTTAGPVVRLAESPLAGPEALMKDDSRR
jgi:hypothetical protein